jgi:hypothetical protein
MIKKYNLKKASNHQHERLTSEYTLFSSVVCLQFEPLVRVLDWVTGSLGPMLSAQGWADTPLLSSLPGPDICMKSSLSSLTSSCGWATLRCSRSSMKSHRRTEFRNYNPTTHRRSVTMMLVKYYIVAGIGSSTVPSRSPQSPAACGVCPARPAFHQGKHACRNTSLQTDRFPGPGQSIYTASYCKRKQDRCWN